MAGIKYTGTNINLLIPQMYIKLGINYEENRKLPIPGDIKEVAIQPQIDLKEVPNFSYQEDDNGGIEVGFV